jgi:hypothetical protein
MHNPILCDTAAEDERLLLATLGNVQITVLGIGGSSALAIAPFEMKIISTAVMTQRAASQVQSMACMRRASIV